MDKEWAKAAASTAFCGQIENW